MLLLSSSDLLVAIQDAERGMSSSINNNLWKTIELWNLRDKWVVEMGGVNVWGSSVVSHAACARLVYIIRVM